MDKNVQASLSCVGNNFFPLSPEQRDGGDGGQQQTERLAYRRYKIPEIQIIPQNYPQIALILIDLTCNFLNEHLEKRASESQQFIFG